MDIEKEILEKLVYNSSLNYNSLWNKDKYPSSKFNYYLKKLLHFELLCKNDDRTYELTQKGMQHIAELNNKKLEKQIIPLPCSFVLCINSNNQVLLQTRKKQPYLGIINIPGGKVQFGETTKEAGIRELYEESRLKAQSTKLRIVDEIRTYDHKNEIYAHIIAYIHICYDFCGELQKENQEGEMKWYSLNEVKNLTNIFPNLKEVIPLLLREQNEVIIQETNRFKDKLGNFISYEIK